MTTPPIKALERHALDAHRLNWTRDRFWQMHGDAVRQAEPYHRGRYHRLINRLMALVVSGDTDGMEPAGEPWLLDEQQEQLAVDDTTTAARIDWQAAGIGQEVTP
jgi:hypothetical protein